MRAPLRLHFALIVLAVAKCKDAAAPDVLQGASIAFASGWAGNFDVWLRDSTGHLVDLTPSQAFFDGTPAWSPDGQTIAFSSARDGYAGEIYLMNADGSGPTRLTHLQSAAEPSWAPDGTRIAFQSSGDIWIMNADGSGPVRVTYAGGSYPAWSPDGQKIAFNCGFNGIREICAMNVDGSGVTNLTNQPSGEWSPSWSPNGQQIAFFSDRDGRFEIYVMNADGSDQTRLTRLRTSAVNPTWSPDGLTIAFAAGVCCSKDVYLMNPDGSDLRFVPNSMGAEGLFWRP